jgi:hypothetical protein
MKGKMSRLTQNLLLPTPALMLKVTMKNQVFLSKTIYETMTISYVIIIL